MSTSKPASDDNARLFVTSDGTNLVATFALVSSLFLLWGFCNGMIDVMDKHFQDELGLTKSQSAWVQFAHYLGYFLMALPAGQLATRLGYKGGIIVGLLLVAAGGFWFVPATWVSDAAHAGNASPVTAFVAFLCGVCAIAAGLTFLETIANPYTTVLGHSRYAATRINLAQSCNGVGWILGPIVGSMYFYPTDGAGNASSGSETLYIPYVGVAIVVMVLAVIFYFARVPDLKSEDELVSDESGEEPRSIWTQPHFVMAVVAQFFYVAAQAGIFSFFINYMTAETPPISPAWESTYKSFVSHCPGFLQGWLGGWIVANDAGVLAISDKGAANLASLGFVCFLLGRVTGAWLLKRQAAHRVLGLYGLLCTLVCLVVFLKLGWISVGSVFLSYFLMSIMFPTIFALGIHGLGGQAKQASAYIVMAIMGGAILPKLMGYVADEYDMSRGFIVPLLCFVVVAAYGFGWTKLHEAGQRHVG